MLRLGSVVSSASGAAPSQPVRACTLNTIASENPAKLAMLAGLNGSNEKPPGPGLARPDSARTSTTSSSTPPVISMNSVDSLIPRCWMNATNGAPTSTQTGHSHGASMFQFVFSSPSRMNPKKP